MSYPGPVCDHSGFFRDLLPKLPPGPVAEFGCADGGTTVQLAEQPRLVYAFCTFDGIPEADYDAALDNSNPPGKFRPSCPVAERYAEYPNIVPVRGRFAETLKHLDFQRYAFGYIDCDLYESYKQVLAYLPQRILPGGCFMSDDYYLAGAKKAVSEWLTTPEGLKWNFDAHKQLFTRKADTPQEPPAPVPIQAPSGATKYILPMKGHPSA